jgi:putative transposase
MKTSRFTDSQIMAILKQAEAGMPAPELCREHGISIASFFSCQSPHSSMHGIYFYWWVCSALWL